MYNGLMFNPDNWENDRRNTNCYTYAIDMPKNPLTGKDYSNWDEVQVGNLGGKMRKKVHWDCSNVVECFLVDAEDLGLEVVPTTFEAVYPSEWWKVAVFYDDMDYHWYRQNIDGTWSHKMGKRAVSNYDVSGEIIKNPLYCRKNGYENFGGFFMIRRRVQ